MTTVRQAWNPDDAGHRRPPAGCKPDPESSLTILARAKLTYAPPNLPELWIKRRGYAFESFVELKRSPEEAASAQADPLERYLDSQLSAGRYWTAKQLETAGELGMTRAELRKAIARLEVSGRVIAVPLPKEHRQGQRKTFLCPSQRADSLVQPGALSPEGLDDAPCKAPTTLAS